MNHTLHQQLVQLRQNAAAWVGGQPVDGFSPDDGICSNLHLDEAGCCELYVLMRRWPHKTDDIKFPVPHPAALPYEAYLSAPPAERWNPEHEYARNRWALLEWLIEQTASETDQ